MQVIDLSMAIDKNTPIYPGDPKQIIKSIATIEKDGWNEKRITLNSHFSTHIDAPYHIFRDGRKLDDFPIETFIGKAVIIDVRGQNEIDADLTLVKQGDIVFFFTGHTMKLSSADFFTKNPVISKKTAKQLIAKKIKIVGIDSFSPDNKPFEIHKLFLKNNILIVENLVNLKMLAGKRCICHIMPLKIKDADGVPCRVIACLG